MRQFNGWINDIIQWPETMGKWLKYFETIAPPPMKNKKNLLSRIENFIRYHKGFSEFADNKKLLFILSELMGEPVLFFKEKLNLKPSGGKGYKAHQDAPAFFDINYDAISMLIPIDEMTIESGCVYFVEEGKGFTNKMLEQNKHNRALSEAVVKQFSWVPIDVIQAM